MSVAGPDRHASGGKLPPQVKTITAEGIVRANSEKDLRENILPAILL